MLKRKIDIFLKNWKEKINRKPLIISGARQIGKTTSIREFGKSYKSFIEIDFVKMTQFQTIFKKVITVINYKKSTIVFLQEILNFCGVENNLNIYLSSVSKCKYSKMEEIYINESLL